MNLPQAIQLLGANARKLRIDLGLKQEQLAESAGVGLSTVKAFEAGKSISLANFAKIMEPLGCLDTFTQIIPDVAPNPIDLMKLKGKTRQRVR